MGSRASPHASLGWGSARWSSRIHRAPAVPCGTSLVPPSLPTYGRPLSPPQQRQQERWKTPLSISAEDWQRRRLPPSGCLGSQPSSPTPLMGLLALLRNKPLKMLIISGASVQAQFPWGQFRPSRVHAIPVPPPSALSLPGAVGARLASVWRRRPKMKFVLCIRDPAYTKVLGRRWLHSPHSRGYSNPSAPRPPSKLRTCTHTHTHTHTRTRGKWGPQQAGGTRGGGREGGYLPKTMLALSQEKCVISPLVAGSTEVPSTPLPHTQPQPPGHNAKRPRCPASSHLPLKTEFFLTVSHSPPHGTTDLRSFDGGTWLRQVP